MPIVYGEEGEEEREEKEWGGKREKVERRREGKREGEWGGKREKNNVCYLIWYIVTEPPVQGLIF